LAVSFHQKPPLGRLGQPVTIAIQIRNRKIIQAYSQNPQKGFWKASASPQSLFEKAPYEATSRRKKFCSAKN
jgi:hypothetical protein